jgi:hypothetical protein
VEPRYSPLFPADARPRFWDIEQQHGAEDRAAAAGEPGVAGHRGDLPKCHGKRHVYYLHAGQPGVEVVGGKRVTCPVCAGEGSVRTPLRTTTDSVG